MQLPEQFNLTAFVQSNLPLIIKILVTFLLAWVGSWLVNRLRRRLKKHLSVEADGRATRLVTLISVGSQVARAVIWLIALFTILGTLGVNLTPIITSLGVVGLALSLGAQTLIKDYFGGLMILIEDQFTVGEWVTIGPVSGTVEYLSLRLTKLRDVNGKLHIVPNGEVRILTNSSRDWLLAIVDLNLELETDLDKALELLEEAMRRATADETLADTFQEPPKVQGWNKLLDWAVQVRLSARTHPDKRIAAEIALRRYALDTLYKGGVQLAKPLVERASAR